MSKITLEQKKNAVKIAIGGGNPLTYLKQIGSKNPGAAWYMIKKQLQSADPEAYEKLQKRQESEKTLEEAMQGMKDAVDEFVDGVTQSRAPELVAKVDGPVIVETQEGGQVQMVGGVTITNDEIKIMNPYLSNGMAISAIYDEKLGEFYRNQRDEDKSRFIEWRTGYGDEVILSVDVWKMMADRLPEIMKVLGVCV